MSVRDGLVCVKKTLGDCGVIANVEAGDTVKWLICVENPGSVPILGVTLFDDPACMPELDPASFVWTVVSTGGASGAADGAGVLEDTIDFPPCSSVTYCVEGVVRDDPICPSWLINTSVLSFTAADGKLYCKSLSADPVEVGSDSSGFAPEPCDPKTLAHDDHAWRFFGGDDPAAHAQLVQMLQQGITLVSLLKALDPAVLEAAAKRASPVGYDNLQWPSERALTATAVSETGPPFEGGPGDQP